MPGEKEGSFPKNARAITYNIFERSFFLNFNFDPFIMSSATRLLCPSSRSWPVCEIVASGFEQPRDESRDSGKVTVLL
jgi:hypothetical protein